MGIALTEHQMMILKHMVRMSEAFANNLYHIMENHGLDKIEGCSINIDVDPKYKSITKKISIGERDSAFGFAEFIMGVHEDAFKLWDASHSKEYDRLFKDEAIRGGIKVSEESEKPLPPDGLWIGDPRYDCSVDCRWEWDVNDSLS